MEKKSIAFELLVYRDQEELSQMERELLDAAAAARENAYAPYSRFKVGAALLLDNGELVVGNNQENASYPAGLCAERVAVFQAGARFPGRTILSMAICVGAPQGQGDFPVAPCGNCRQAIIEYEHGQGSPIPILMRGGDGPVYKCGSISDILPLAFNRSFLGDS